MGRLHWSGGRLVGLPADVGHWFARLHARHPRTARHSWRVAESTRMLAESSGRFDDEELEEMTLGALLHDLGKIAVPRAILDKAGPLTEEEWDVMHLHPQWGGSFLREDFGDRPLVLDAVRHEHERWDGGGYPDGLAGERIPEVARLIMITDTIDAVTEDRSYRSGRPLAVALRILAEGAGTQFDPAWVRRALRLWTGSSIPRLQLLPG